MRLRREFGARTKSPDSPGFLGSKEQTRTVWSAFNVEALIAFASVDARLDIVTLGKCAP
jgi:hypothetical protein